VTVDSKPGQGTTVTIHLPRSERALPATAGEGAPAASQRGVAVDLVFSDIVMPGWMNGIALAEACRERYPEIPVLLTSGYSDAAQVADGRFAILCKPFDLASLQRAIEMALSGCAKPGRVRAD